MQDKVYSWDQIKGQDSKVALFKKRIELNRLDRAYLFYGPEGVGKTALAKLIVMAANCEAHDRNKPCGVCPTCKRLRKSLIEDYVNSNEVVIINGSANIKDHPELGDEINSAITETGLLAPGHMKFVLIEEADHMHTSVQQAINKASENVPDNVVVIMFANVLSDLLPSLKSRYVDVEFFAPPKSAVVEILRDAARKNHIKIENENAIFSIIADNCNCRPRAALQKLAQFLPEETTTYDEAKDIVNYLPLSSVVPILSSLSSSGSRLQGISAARRLNLDHGGHLQLIDICTEALSICLGNLSLKYSKEDMALLADAVKEVDPDVLTNFICFLANMPGCSPLHVIAAFLNAHPNKSGIGERLPNERRSELDLMIQTGAANNTTLMQEMDKGVSKKGRAKAPTLDDLMKNGIKMK